VILVTVMKTHPVDSELRFDILERPAIGMVRILQPIGDNAELLHLAESGEAAALWLAKYPHPSAWLSEVTGGGFVFTPFGHLAEGNPYEAYLPPDPANPGGFIRSDESGDLG